MTRHEKSVLCQASNIWQKAEVVSKSNQTLAIPFRLVQFLPYEVDVRECWDGMSESEGNCVGVQVDMRNTEPTARQELNILDKETQRNANIIESVVFAS